MRHARNGRSRRALLRNIGLVLLACLVGGADKGGCPQPPASTPADFVQQAQQWLNELQALQADCADPDAASALAAALAQAQQALADAQATQGEIDGLREQQDAALNLADSCTDNQDDDCYEAALRARGGPPENGGQFPIGAAAPAEAAGALRQLIEAYEDGDTSRALDGKIDYQDLQAWGGPAARLATGFAGAWATQACSYARGAVETPEGSSLAASVSDAARAAADSACAHSANAGALGEQIRALSASFEAMLHAAGPHPSEQPSEVLDPIIDMARQLADLLEQLAEETRAAGEAAREACPAWNQKCGAAYELSQSLQQQIDSLQRQGEQQAQSIQVALQRAQAACSGEWPEDEDPFGEEWPFEDGDRLFKEGPSPSTPGGGYVPPPVG